MTKEPYICPQNRMNPEDIAQYDVNTDQPIIEMSETSKLLYIFSVPLIFQTPIGDTEMQFMASAVYDTKLKNIGLRGRMRYEDTGRKSVFGFKDRFELKDINKAKAKVLEMYQAMTIDLQLTAKKKPVELNFAVDEDIDSIIQKMNNSNEFNIGIIPKN